MKVLKSVLLLISLFCGFALWPSCSEETPDLDPCAEVNCEHGADCIDGDCVCGSVLSQAYLMGNWNMAGGLFIGTFYHDATYIASNSSTLSYYTLDQTNNIINFYAGSGGPLLLSYDVQGELSCNSFDYIVSTTGFQFTAGRQE